MNDFKINPRDRGRGLLLFIEFKEVTHDYRFDEIQAYEFLLLKDNIAFASMY